MVMCFYTHTHIQFSPSNIGSMAAQRVEEGHLTVNFDRVNWDMVVINDAKDKPALIKLYEMLERLRAGKSLSGKKGSALECVFVWQREE